MICKKYPHRTNSGCPRPARWIINKLPLCAGHAQQQPLEIVLSNPEKWRKWITVEPVPEGQQCQARGGCARAPGSRISFAEFGRATFTVNGSKPQCRYHAGELVWAELQFGPYLGRLIRTLDLTHKPDKDQDNP